MNESGAERRCRACGETIATTAILCKHCGSYQNRGWNWLVRLAQISGFIAALGAAVIFVITNAPVARKALSWRDNLKVLGFKSNEYLLAGNEGDGPVYVSHVSLVMDLAPFGEKRTTRRLNVLVPQDTITSIPIAPDFEGERLSMSVAPL